MQGAPVDRDHALIAATRWQSLTPNPMGKPAGKLGKVETFFNAAGEARFHVVHLEPAGYVVFSADDELEPIIAFSHLDTFVGQAGNPLFDLLHKDTENRMRHLHAKPANQAPALSQPTAKGKWAKLTASSVQAPAAPTDTGTGASSVDDVCVAPLTQSRWSQSTIWNGSSDIALYNYFTPPFAAGNAANYYSGCTATAWAQIMRFHQWPTTAVGTTSFPISVSGSATQRSLRGGDGAGGVYNWANMVLVPSTTITLQQCQAIGSLLADAGVANNMDYASDGSGAYLHSTTIKSAFHYANAVRSDYYDTLDDYFLILRTNLEAGLPVALSIYSDTEGHEVVCDGYGYSLSSLYHHINMGWGGVDDLWYNLPVIYTFDTIGDCCYNIDPTVVGEIISGRVTNTDGTPRSGVTVTLSGSGTRTATTNQYGIFAFKGVSPYSTWTATPTSGTNVFSPKQTVVNTGYSQDYSTPGNQVADFQIASIVPVVTTGAATNTTTSSTTLAGSVNPNGFSTTALFEYGLTTAYGSTAPVTLSPSNGVTAQNVTVTINGLQTGLLYHYRISATNINGTRTGADMTFQTVGLPVAVTGSASSISATYAWLLGTVNPCGSPTTAQFEYGPTTSYGSTASVTLSPNNGSTVQNVSTYISGLQVGATYHYRLTATNTQGDSIGSDGSFTTQVMVSTFAGSPGLSGSTDATGANARFFNPYGIATDASGNLYVADEYNCTIRKITSAGVVTTFAGKAGLSGTTDGAATVARFATPVGMAVDAAGNVYVGDSSSNTIRKITSAGSVSTFAGKAGLTGSSDGSGSSARFSAPMGVAADKSNNVYVADSNNSTIRKITSGGSVNTFAGKAGLSGTSDASTGSAARFNYASGVAVDTLGNVYVADSYNCTIRKITTAGVVTTIAGTPGAVGSSDGVGKAASFNFPCGVAVDAAGNVYVADTNNYTIRKITPAGVVTTLAGYPGYWGSGDGTGDSALFDGPCGVAVDGAGNLYVSDQNNQTIRKITQFVDTSPVVTLVGSSPMTIEASASFTDPGATAIDVTGKVLTPTITANTVVANKPGTYIVRWVATDSLARSGTATRTVKVVDTTVPVITVPSNITAYATSATGANVSFVTSATDIADGSALTINNPASGSLFLIGTTPVTTTATDAAGNTASKNFSVTVAVPAICSQEKVATQVSITGNIVNLTVTASVPGRCYQLQYSDTLTSGSWINAGSAKIGTGGDLIISTLRDPAVPRRFYRLKLD